MIDHVESSFRPEMQRSRWENSGLSEVLSEGFGALHDTFPTGGATCSPGPSEAILGIIHGLFLFVALPRRSELALVELLFCSGRLSPPCIAWGG